MAIHPTAVIDARAELDSTVEVGPYAVIEAGVAIGARCRIDAHAHLRGPLILGEDNVVGHSVAVGHAPQVKDLDGPGGATRIGRGNVLREFTSVHRSMKSEGLTSIGDENYFMASSHVGHDSAVGNHVILCNQVLLGGHVTVEDRAFFGGGSAVHQFSRVGTLAMIGGHCSVSHDAPPFCTSTGSRPTRVQGLNRVGLRRAGLDREARQALQQAYRILFRTNLPLPERLAAVQATTPEVEHLLRFLRDSPRGVIGFGRA